jgi:hypothetical protein
VSEVARSHGGDGPTPEEWRRTVWGHAWLLWCQMLIALGLVCTLSHWDLLLLIGLTVTATVCAAVVAAVVGQDEGLTRAGRILKNALSAGLAVSAAAGLAAVLGYVGLLLVLVTGGTAPVCAAGVVRRWKASKGGIADARRPDLLTTSRQQPDRHPGGEVERILQPQSLDMLDDAALCLAWRRSFLLLKSSTSVIELLSIVKRRQEYLDELQRRSPQGLAEWLDAGARASSNPLPYLSGAPHGPE